MTTDMGFSTQVREKSLDPVRNTHAAVVQLVRKDVEQHSKQVVGLMALLCLTIGFTSAALTRDPLKSYLIGSLAFGVIALLPVQLGQWLVLHERLQRTFKFLKMLPLTAEQVVLAKFATGWLFLSFCFAVFSVLPFLVGTYFFSGDSYVSVRDI